MDPSDVTLVDTAYRKLREDILAGRKAAGERLRVEHLRVEYGVGSTPLREALSRLSSESLVQSVGQRGFRVASVSPEELEDVTEMRVMLENEALARSIERGTLEWEANVVAAHHTIRKLDALAPGGDSAQFALREEKNEAFHDALVAACGSPWLLRMRNTLYDQHQRYRWLAIEMHSQTRDLAKEHADLVDAVLARDAKRACELNAEHIRETAHVIRKNIASKLGHEPKKRAVKGTRGETP